MTIKIINKFYGHKPRRYMCIAALTQLFKVMFTEFTYMIIKKCHNIISSTNITVWNHSKFSYETEFLPNFLIHVSNLM